MSTLIMSACWSLQMPPTIKAVMISLADNANDSGVCWPAIPTICKRTCLGRTAVIGAVKWLEAHGALTKDGGGGAGRSNHYTLTPSNYQKQSASRTVRDVNGSPPEQKQSASRTKTVRHATPNRKEPSRTIKEGATAPEVDPDKAMWDAGVAAGIERVVIGKCVKEHGKAQTMRAIATTVADKPADPKTYLLGVLRKSAASGNAMKAEFARAI